MTDVLASTLSIDEARELTDEIKSDAAALWTKLLLAYEGGAHTALGYSSWGDYYSEEFGEPRRTGYRLLDAARVVETLSVQLDTHVPPESVAREIAPVLKDHGPEAVEEVWGEVVHEHGPTPTAAQVREVVQREEEPVPVGPRKLQQQIKIVAGMAERARHIHSMEQHLDLEAIRSLPTEEKERWRQQLADARTVLSRLIGAL